jgi:ubiquitin-conjugating enzyme E2 G1
LRFPDTPCHLLFEFWVRLSPLLGGVNVSWTLVIRVCEHRYDKNGKVCISILHEPGDDRYGYEKASERWLPIHTVETILISVISMLADPNDESPANVDAAKEWREAYPEFKKKVARCVRKSQEEL